MVFVKVIPQVTLWLKPGRGNNRLFRQHQQRGTTVCSRHARVVEKIVLQQSPSKLSVQLCVQVQSFIMKVGRGKIAAVSSAHIILGILMAVCGGLQIKLQLKFLWLDSLHAGIWVGIWVSHTHQY